MKYISIFLSIILFLFLCSCEEEQESSADAENEQSFERTDNTQSDETDEGGYNPFTSSPEGIEKLNELLADEGWRSTEKYDGEYIHFSLSIEAETTYELDWDGVLYEVYSDGFWITLFDVEDLASVEDPMGECYSVRFQGPDTFLISHIHMCAVNKDDIWDTYVRNTRQDESVVFLNKSNDPADIKTMFEKVDGKYIECEYVKERFKKVCFPSNITKYNFNNEMPNSFWVDFLQDGYEFKIHNVSYDPSEPNRIVFEGSGMFTNEKALLTFQLENKYKTAVLKTSQNTQLYMQADHHEGIPGPDEPCDDMEGEY